MKSIQISQSAMILHSSRCLSDNDVLISISPFCGKECFAVERLAKDWRSFRREVAIHTLVPSRLMDWETEHTTESALSFLSLCSLNDRLEVSPTH